MSIKIKLAAAALAFTAFVGPAAADGVRFDFGFYGPAGTIRVEERGGVPRHVERGVERRVERRDERRDGYRPYRAELPVGHVASQLRHEGFRHVRFMNERRGAYIFAARGHRGMVRVVVDKYDGRIINVVRI